MTIIAVIKHISIKNSNYDAATDYLTLKHDEYTSKPILDENGNKIPRDEFIIEGINCNPFTFGRECEATNAVHGKNQTKEEIKAHHYIISFDPRDRDENGLTLEQAKSLAVNFAKKNFPGHQTIVCAHPDGHNSAGNIHVHIVINSVRKFDISPTEYASIIERPGDALAGHKHHVTNQFLEYIKQETMNMCQENSLYQVDLLAPAKVKITDREYWARRKGQAKLDAANAQKLASGVPAEEIKTTKYKTDKDFLRETIYAVLSDITIPKPIDSASSYSKEELLQLFSAQMFESYGITVHESRGHIGYILPDKTKPIRGRQLGTDFEIPHILQVLEEKAAPERGTPNFISHNIKFLTNLSHNLKAQQNFYYARKIKISNLKQLANTITFLEENGIQSMEELQALLQATKEDNTIKHNSVKSVEAQLKHTNLLIKNTGQYLANKDTYRQYLKSKNKAAFREEHHAELTLYEAARTYLKSEGYLVKGNRESYLPSIPELKEQKAKLVSLKNSCYEEYSYSRSKYREIQAVVSNVSVLMEPPKVKTQQQEQQKKNGQPDL